MSEFLEFTESSEIPPEQPLHPLELFGRLKSDLNWVSWIPASDPRYNSPDAVSARRQLTEIQAEEASFREAHPEEASTFDQDALKAPSTNASPSPVDDGWGE